MKPKAPAPTAPAVPVVFSAESLHIRWPIRRDMPQVLAIEKATTKNSPAFRWDEDRFLRTLRQRNVIGMVIEDSAADIISGFMLYELNRNHLNILKFAVSPQFQRCGVGSKLIDKLAGKLSPDRRKRILVTVPDFMLDAQLFFKAMGFRAIAVNRKCFDGCDGCDGCDGYLSQYRIREESGVRE